MHSINVFLHLFNLPSVLDELRSKVAYSLVLLFSIEVSVVCVAGNFASLLSGLNGGLVLVTVQSPKNPSVLHTGSTLGCVHKQFSLAGPYSGWVCITIKVHSMSILIGSDATIMRPNDILL